MRNRQSRDGMSERTWRVRVDTGGTFTDAWARDPEGGEFRCKILSDGRLRLRLRPTPRTNWWGLDGVAGEWADGVLSGWQSVAGQWVTAHVRGEIELLAEGGMVEISSGEEAPVVAARILTATPLGEPLPTMDLRVATTRGTNALLERKGARVAMFVSAGLEDVLDGGDQRRADLFALGERAGDLLAERVIGVSGWLNADGIEDQPLDESAVRAAAREAREAGCEVAAVALRHAWKNPDHERAVADWLRDEGFAWVTCSHEVAPLIRWLPRAETAMADAFLTPVMRAFIERVSGPMGDQAVWMMSSAGGLVPSDRFHPKDSLLSGPAGGLIGATTLARAAGSEKLLTFDMGGTSTDVARVSGPFRYRQEQRIGAARVLAPAMEIETVAAGGGSICRWRHGQLEVGPESAGSDPGPACYGRGGPLTLTDVNLLLGMMDADKAGIPLDRAAAEVRLDELGDAMRADGVDPGERDALLAGLRAMAVERMAEAIRSVSMREGVDVSDHVLVAFGGAGPQHACELAEKLGMSRVLVPGDAGLLSAWGLDRAVRQEQRVAQILQPIDEVSVGKTWESLERAAASALGETLGPCRRLAALRLTGQDSALDIEVTDAASDDADLRAQLTAAFERHYRRIYGYPPPRGKSIECVSLRVVVEGVAEDMAKEDWDAGEECGPLLEQDHFSTCYLADGWRMRRSASGTKMLERIAAVDERLIGASNPLPTEVQFGLLRSRFEGILGSMGEALRRTAISTNVKERLDYSCALLDDRGRLVASAPHVPVHLGALGVCVREVSKRLELKPGDVAITNAPGAGGSHLPDVTLVAPVHDERGGLIGYVANRAHHAEIGGMAPGSMPARARNLAQEGVVIEPMKLVEAGQPNWAKIEAVLRGGDYPSRCVSDNLADIEAQLAACHFARGAITDLAGLVGVERVRETLQQIVDRSAARMRERWDEFHGTRRAVGSLDDGTPLAVAFERKNGKMVVDFSGSGPVHPGNLNATPAIVRSVLLYVLRVWLDDDVPLNEGLLDAVDIVLPRGLLNPDFGQAPDESPAVVGGNVEVSQRLADLCCEALGLCAHGPGTMNNVLFGNAGFGYYETLAGGGGAGEGFHGASVRHVHMTNTALTDPEVLERVYPVKIRQHARRRGSGGMGRWRGGDGVVREIEFLEFVTVSLLTQSRQIAPRGCAGGGDGKVGRQFKILQNGEKQELGGVVTVEFEAGERLWIETPGGGGWGSGG